MEVLNVLYPLWPPSYCAFMIIGSLFFGSFSHIVTLPSTATLVRMVAFIGSTVQTVFPFAFSLGEYGRLHWQHCTSLPVLFLSVTRDWILSFWLILLFIETFYLVYSFFLPSRLLTQSILPPIESQFL